MRTNQRTLGRGAAALGLATLAAIGLAAAPAHAAEYWLRAAPATVQMPNPDGSATQVPVTMWGYASCAAAFATCGPVTVPGPALGVAPGDTTLTVHLSNTLAVPTSLVVNGLTKAMAPVWTDGTSGPRTALTQRVRSFDAEAAPNNTQDYTWTNVAPGTYLYQSGTQPQVQVQMGLYGAVTKNAIDVVTGATPVRGQAYAATPTQAAAAFEYDNQALLLYSEIDPALHAAVAAGTYGAACPPATPDCGNPTSTLTYAPKYFLVNGQPYPFGSPVMAPEGNPGRTLLRLLNAGLVTHVPMVQGAYWTVIAEDGKVYPYPRTQYTALLPAAKTMDVLLSADSSGGAYAIMDRRLALSNAGVSNGGMLTVLQYAAAGTVGGGGVGDPNLPPAPVADTYNSIVGVTLTVGAPEGVLVNDSDPDGLPLPLKAVVASGATSAGGTYTMNANGSFTYTAPATLPSGGADTFAYQVTDGKAISASTVTINLSVPTAPAVAVLDNFNRADSTSLGAAWTQTAASGQFPDVQIAANRATAATANLGGLAIWNAGAFGATQGASFANAAPLANVALVLKASGGTVAAPANFVRVRCEAANGGELVIATLMGGSNTGVYVKQASFAAAACAGNGSLSAVVDGKGLVTTFVNGVYVGGVQLPDVGAWKGTGYVGLQVQSVGAVVDDFGGF